MANEVADRVYRLGADLVNWFIVEDGGKLTIIDAGNPSQFDQLPAAVSTLGHAMGDIEAIVLTHAHGDHLRSSERIQCASGASVHVHHDDVALNIVTGDRTPRIMPGSFNKDSELSLQSLDSLRGSDASLILPGHGEPLHGKVDDAVTTAQRTGAC